MAETPSKSADYMPIASAASLRMADSVLRRLGGPAIGSGPSARPPRENGVAAYVTAPGVGTQGRPAQRDEIGGAKPDEMALAAASAAPDRDGDFQQGATLPVLSQSGLRAPKAHSDSVPLWSGLPPNRELPMLDGLDADSRPPSPAASLQPPKAATSRAPNLPLLQGGKSEAADASTATQPAGRRPEPGVSPAVQDASLRLLDALRAHAAAQALSGHDRITLSDLTTIAFADQNQQMAAHESGPAQSAPETRSASAQSEARHANWEADIDKCAQAVIDECQKSQQMNRARTHGY